MAMIRADASIPGTNEIRDERLMATPLMRGDEVTGMMAVWRTTSPSTHAI